MKTFLMCFLILSLITIGGCAWLDTQFVPEYDEAGNEIGRAPTETVKAVADAVPYGNVALNAALLLFAGVAKFKQYKTEKGLMATVTAIKSASKDPEIETAIEKLKQSYLQPSQTASGSEALIKMMLAKL